MVTLFAGPTSIETVRGEEPQYRLREVDQTAPAGMWRIDVQADEMLFQRATASDWSTALTVVTLNSSGVVVYSGAITFSGDVTLEDDIKLNFGDDADFTMDFDSAGSTFDFVAGAITVLQVAKATGDATFAQDVTVTGSLGSGAITSSGIVKTTDATEATTTSDGSISTAGGLSLVKDAIFGNDIKMLTDSAVFNMGVDSDFTITHDGTTGVTLAGNPITITSAGAATWSTGAGVLTLDGNTGIKLQTTGSGNVEVAEILDITDTTDASDASGSTGALRTLGGASIAKKVYVGTDLDVEGTANLDIVDIDGNTQIDGTLSVGINDTGQDVTFYGATDGAYLLWDESADDLVLAGDAELKILGDNPSWEAEHVLINNTGGNGMVCKMVYKTVVDETATAVFDVTTYDSATHGGGEYMCKMKVIAGDDTGNNASGAAAMGWEGAFAVANQHNMGDGYSAVVESLQTAGVGPDTGARQIGNITVTVTSSADNVHEVNFNVDGTGSLTPQLRVAVWVEVIHRGYRYNPTINQL